MTPNQEEIIREYNDVFGNTVTVVTAGPDSLKRIVAEMRKALAGGRGPLADAEFYGDIPSGAVM